MPCVPYWSLHVLDWADRQRVPATAALTLVEFRCLLARRRRAEPIDAALERCALAESDGHVRGGVWQIQSVALKEHAAARHLIDIIPAFPCVWSMPCTSPPHAQVALPRWPTPTRSRPSRPRLSA